MEFTGSVESLASGRSSRIFKNFLFQKSSNATAASRMTDECGRISLEDELTSFVWTFDFLSAVKLKYGKCIYSPPFYTTSPHDRTECTEWKLQIYPNGINRSCRHCVSLFLVDTSKSEKKSNFVQRAAYFSLVGANSIEINRTNVEIFSMGCQTSWGVEQFIEVKVLKNPDSVLLRDGGQATIKCCIGNINTLSKYVNPIKSLPRSPLPLPRSRSLSHLLNIASEECMVGSISESKESLEAEDSIPDDERESKSVCRDEFEELLETGDSDVILTYSNDKSFFAHSVILSNRSKVFEELVKNSSIINVKDVDRDTLLEVMRFVYLGKTTEKLPSLATKVVDPANRFGLTELKTKCEEIMIQNLNIDNASEYLVLSFHHKIEKLQERAMEFMVSNSLDVTSTPGFKTMAGDHAQVIIAIFRALKKFSGVGGANGSGAVSGAGTAGAPEIKVRTRKSTRNAMVIEELKKKINEEEDEDDGVRLHEQGAATQFSKLFTKTFSDTEDVL